MTNRHDISPGLGRTERIPGATDSCQNGTALARACACMPHYRSVGRASHLVNSGIVTRVRSQDLRGSDCAVYSTSSPDTK